MHLSYYRRPLFVFLIFYISFLAVFKNRSTGQVEYPACGDEEVEIEGRVDTYPRRRDNEYSFVISSRRETHKKIFVHAEAPVPAARGARGTDCGQCRPVPPGFKDNVKISGTLRRPFSYAVPGNLDWREYLNRSGIMREMRASSITVVSEANFVFKTAGFIRFAVLDSFDSRLKSPEHSAILSGIVLGEKKQIPKELKKSFQDSGAMHLLVASGSNVGFITFIVYFLCAAMGLKKRVSGIIGSIIAGLYVLAAGLDPPLVRAYLMFISALAGFIIERESGVFHGLLISCFLITVYAPDSVSDAGFQMSFLATLGIVIGMANYGRYVSCNKFSSFWGKILGIMMISFFAQSGIYPLMAIYFHKVSVISIVSNLILVPLSGFLMALGFCLAVSTHIAVVGDVFSAATEWSVWFFKMIVEFFGNLKFSSITAASPGFLELFSYFGMIFLIWNLPLFGFKNKKVYYSGAAFAVMFLIGRLLPEKSAVYLFSDKDSNCVVIRTDECGLFMVNPGAAGEKLANAVLHAGFKKADAVFLSSTHKSSWSGLEEMSQFIEVRKIFLPFGPGGGELKKFLERLPGTGKTIERMWPGDKTLVNDCIVQARWPLQIYPVESRFAGTPPQAGLFHGAGRSIGYAGRNETIGWLFSFKDFELEISKKADFVRIHKTNKAGTPVSGREKRAEFYDVFSQKGEVKIFNPQGDL
ncbi:MAG: ComEC/Rec2 family competence protein [Elusimicrobia bacterium]|nr:ComEC/Rec2 family competence protein [Elusimicrobiota bacterium]